jgi:hypothetical protein
MFWFIVWVVWMVFGESLHLLVTENDTLGPEASDKHTVRRKRILLFTFKSDKWLATLDGVPDSIRYYGVDLRVPIGISPRQPRQV